MIPLNRRRVTPTNRFSYSSDFNPLNKTYLPWDNPTPITRPDPIPDYSPDEPIKKQYLPLDIGPRKPSPYNPSGPSNPNDFGRDPIPKVPAQPEQTFAQQYADLNKPGTNRLAYQKAVDEGSPEISRGKWAKLGAILGGAATGYSTGNPIQGYQLAMSAYEQPQKRADELYDKKLVGLEKLSGFEDNDRAAKIRALEASRADWFNTERNTRENADQQRAQSAEERAVASDKLRNQLTEKQIEAIAYERLIPVKNEKTGMTQFIDPKDQTVKFEIATSLTPKEIRDNANEALKDKLKIEEPYNVNASERALKQAESVARIGATSRDYATDQRAASAREKNLAHLKGLKPNEQITQAWADVMNKAAGDEDLRNIALQDYITEIPGPNGTKLLRVKPKEDGVFGYGADNAQDAAIKEKLNKLISGSMTESKPNTSNTINQNPGNYPVDPDGLVEVTSPDGKETKRVTPLLAFRIKREYPASKIKGVK